MGRPKNACFNMLTCAGAGGGGGDVAADPANVASDVAADCQCEETKALSDKSRWSFRRRSTRHRVLRNNEAKDPEPVTNKENPNLDPLSENNNNNNVFASPKYSSATEKSVLEQDKPKENNVILREFEENPTEIEEKFSLKENDNNVEALKENSKEIDEKIEENNVVIVEREIDENLDLDLGLDLKEDLEKKEMEINLDQIELTDNNEDENEDIEQAALVIQSGFRGYKARREVVKIEKIVMIQALVRGYLVRSQMVGTLRCLLAIIKMQSMVRSHQVKGDSKIYSSNENIILNGFASKIMETMPKSKVIHIKCDPYKPNSTWEWFERWTYAIISSNGPDFSIQNKILEDLGEKLESNDEEISYLGDELLPIDSDSNSKFNPIEIEESHAQIENLVKEEMEVELPKSDIVEENSISDSKIETEFEFEFEKSESNNLNETNLEEENETNKPDTKKPINPAFAAAQMKFQELASIPNPDSNSNSSIARSLSPNSNSYTFPSPKNIPNNNPKATENENKINNNTNNSYNITRGGNLLKATSECGTEISISSTLDSPDRSETEGGEIVLEIGNYQNTLKPETQKSETETPNPISEFETHEIEKDEQPIETPQQTTTTTTTTDLNLTPSSQASVNTKTKKSKKDKNHRNKKPNSAKRSLNTSPITESNLVGDAEPRMSNSSLPSYMQATLSARAKACNGSLKLSPDLSNNIVKESESNEKIEKKSKRHSLPSGGSNGKDVSPRMVRSQSSEDKRWQI